MRYYTKEWYELMQRQHYTSGVKKLPDRVYTDADIEAMYAKKRKQFIAYERRCYNLSPASGPSEFPRPELLDDEDMRYIAELTGAEAVPKNTEEFLTLLEAENKRALDEWERRPPFDAEGSGRLFDEIYKNRLTYCLRGLPEWAAGEADARLLAMDMLPEGVYTRLKAEERLNRAAFLKIERAAEKELSAHRLRLPPETLDGFCFHDADVLSLKRRGGDYVMLLNVCGAGCEEPYMRVTFVGAWSVERERGLRLRVSRACDGSLTSSCRYLYDELYAVDGGVEAHMLLSTTSLKYLTVKCRSVRFEAGREAEL